MDFHLLFLEFDRLIRKLFLNTQKFIMEMIKHNKVIYD